MKKFTKLLSLLLVMALAISVVACSSYGKVEKAIEELGFTVVESENQAEEYKDEERITNVHVFEKSVGLIKDYVIVLEFKSTDKLVEYYNESDTLKGLVSDISKNEDVKAIHAKLEETGFACDNCLIVPSLLNVLDVTAKIAELNK